MLYSSHSIKIGAAEAVSHIHHVILCQNFRKIPPGILQLSLLDSSVAKNGAVLWKSERNDSRKFTVT